jgi:hypothetical protein
MTRDDSFAARGRVTFGQVQASNSTIRFMGNFLVCLKGKSKRDALESRSLYNSKL